MPSKNKNILYICTRLWFESSVFFRYSKNTLVFRNIEVSNTLRYLALVKSVVLTTLCLKYIKKRVRPLFLIMKYWFARHNNTAVCKYFDSKITSPPN